MALVALGRLFATRKAFWESEKTKWEAKSTRRDYEERIEPADAAKLTETEKGQFVPVKHPQKIPVFSGIPASISDQQQLAPWSLRWRERAYFLAARISTLPTPASPRGGYHVSGIPTAIVLNAGQ